MTEQVAKGRWSDLGRRLVSAVVLVAIAAVDIWTGGLWFILMVAGLVGLMAWELDRMTAPDGELVQAPGLALMAAICLFGAVGFSAPIDVALIGVIAVGFLGTDRRQRVPATLAILAIMLAAMQLCLLQHKQGTPALLWLIGVVIASDVLGYFAGRLLGGPKFWPAISPKKTWSGTVAGWIGAGLVGLGFVTWGGAPWGLVWVSALLALAGQMGDIGESWLKRQAGVKDSSNLIPGHGGVMDRFDALTGAALALFLLLHFFPALPLPLAEPDLDQGLIRFEIPLEDSVPSEPELFGPRIQP
ncbi:phosphatidate cytidylyltransferase [Neogemmobacter tilapiae]|uniref:Phosphatidate cytidylyltransferase n=1 Tax=Neogemmobacter tilapiae TaxID=875041 RepID=A0A918TRA4_9RHOB|nr:phosphatidate cytidylyltransferase [Gemmobacter tilapiae]GHC58437.1 phosphatidate cytidylyltransferase [Gemmobacter tilapiae]